MRTLSIAIAAGQTIEFNIGGTYFHLLETASGVDIDFKQAGAIFASAINMEAGFFSAPQNGFDSISFTSAAAQTIKVAIGKGSGGYNRTIGSVQLTGQQAPFVQGRVNLTNANQTIIAADLTRRYLMVQNNDAAAIMRVKLDGNAATAAQGFRIQPGGYMELAGYACNGAINVMMETATATAGNCEFVSD